MTKEPPNVEDTMLIMMIWVGCIKCLIRVVEEWEMDERGIVRKRRKRKGPCESDEVLFVSDYSM